jgi:hypothetical protein
MKVSKSITAMFVVVVHVSILSIDGILGIISIICLLISLHSKISNNRHKQKERSGYG